MPDVRRVGREAEDRAADELVRLGLTVVTRRYTVRGGEVDLVALDGDVVVFVEVKFRSSPFQPPELAVSAVKAARLRKAAARYVHEMGLQDREVRFDAVAVTPNEVKHLPGVLDY